MLPKLGTYLVVNSKLYFRPCSLVLPRPKFASSTSLMARLIWTLSSPFGADFFSASILLKLNPITAMGTPRPGEGAEVFKCLAGRPGGNPAGRSPVRVPGKHLKTS